MTATEIKSMICDVLSGIAPEADLTPSPTTKICVRRSTSIRWIF